MNPEERVKALLLRVDQPRTMNEGEIAAVCLRWSKRLYSSLTPEEWHATMLAAIKRLEGRT